MNGTPAGFFNSSCDLHQGDLLSLYLLLFVIETFNKIIDGIVEGGFLKGFSAGNKDYGTLDISHFLFVDDTLAFSYVNIGHIQFLRAILICFEAISKLRINLSKFELMMVGAVRDVEFFAFFLNCKVFFFQLKYLGLPLSTFLKLEKI